MPGQEEKAGPRLTTTIDLAAAKRMTLRRAEVEGAADDASKDEEVARAKGREKGAARAEAAEEEEAPPHKFRLWRGG